jgi:hypothetical protein
MRFGGLVLESVSRSYNRLMKTTFWGLIGSSFLEIQTFWYGFLGFVATIFFTIVTGKTLIPLYWILILLSIAILTLATLFRALYKAFDGYEKLRRSNLPRILSSYKEEDTSCILCILEYSEIFSYQMMVSAYYTNQDDLPVLIATGFVEEILYQNHQKIIIKLNILEPGYQKILEKLGNKDKSVIDKTVIKAGATTKVLNKIISRPEFNQF